MLRPNRSLVLPFLGSLLSLAFVAAPASSGDICISEIRIDHPGPDTEEFFEICGPAGATLDRLFYLVIGDGEAGSGVVESVTPLQGQRLDASGYFLARRSGARDERLARGQILDFHFENADNVTHLLVRDFRGVEGQDLDLDDDGYLDLEPWSEVLDALALLASDPDLAGDRAYSRRRIGPDHGFVPTHVFRDGEGWVMGHYELCEEDTPGRTNATILAGTPRLRSHVVSR